MFVNGDPLRPCYSAREQVTKFLTFRQFTESIFGQIRRWSLCPSPDTQRADTGKKAKFYLVSCQLPTRVTPLCHDNRILAHSPTARNSFQHCNHDFRVGK